MEKEIMRMWFASLLMIGGLLHLLPPLYRYLQQLTGGTPWVQIIIGILSVIVALVVLHGDIDWEEKGK